MKYTTITTLATLLLGTTGAMAQSAYTKPSGFETLTLAPGSFNLIGVRLFKPVVVSGTFESFDTVNGTSLTDDEANFDLTATTNYIIEFSNGASINLLGSDFSGTTVSDLTGIDASFLTHYSVREAQTITSVFGAANEAGLASSADADPTQADIVLLPNGAGGFVRVFFSTYAADPSYNGWLDADTFAKADALVIDPSQALYVHTAVSTSPIDLVVTGAVKTTPTAYSADQAFTLLGSSYPVGGTLTTSGLSTYVQASANADPTEADLVLLPNGAGGFVRAFFSTYAADPDYSGWLNADSFAKIPDQPLTSGFFIQLTGPAFDGLNTPPAFYSGL